MLEFNWQNFLVMFLISPLCFLFFFGLTVGWCKQVRKNSVIVFDLDMLADTSTIIERGRIWAENGEKRTFDDYYTAHLSEQYPNPSGLACAIKCQQLGYTLCFVAARPEKTRIEAARFLNQWGLKGQLYMCEDEKITAEALIENPLKFKNVIYNMLASKTHLVGVLDKQIGCTGCIRKRYKA